MFSRFFINRPAFSAVVSIIIVIAGFLCLFSLPIEQYPKLVPTQIVVSANYPGASAETISTNVASILE
ncbi:MAG: efflux RND transporter permease subunit, partial [Helicobacter sp.]|nr:efflux RND transporter permease subunit [Helicobacter sp.]